MLPFIDFIAQVAVLQELFAQCSLKVEDVESIQLVGSVTRMPSLCRAIKVSCCPCLTLAVLPAHHRPNCSAPSCSKL
jgi:hypothetical protein